jgi:hypothetical protein
MRVLVLPGCAAGLLLVLLLLLPSLLCSSEWVAGNMMPMPMLLLVLLPLLLMHLDPAAAGSCASASDCELLGKCVDRACQCFPGFAGPSCAQIDLEPAPAAAPLAAWPPVGGYSLSDRERRAYGWGFSVAPDPKVPGLLHAVANVGCYTPHSGMVSGTFLMHLTARSPTGPWTAVGIVAPPTTFNAHLRLAPGGDYVLFLRGTSPMPSPANWTESACAGVPDADWKAIVSKGPYISADKLQDPIGNFVATAKSMGSDGGWDAKPFQIVGQEATCGNKSVIDHNSNPSATILPSGVVVLAYRYTFTTGSESVNIAVAQNTSGPFEAVFPCNYTMTSNTWGEDPFVFHRRDGSLHMFYHCQRYGHGVPNSPGLHAWSANAGGQGRDRWHTTDSPSGHGAYSTNISLSNGSSTGLLYHRRERPDLLFDRATGNPLAFYSALQETAGPAAAVAAAGQEGGNSPGWGWSFSFAQTVRA